MSEAKVKESSIDKMLKFIDKANKALRKKHGSDTLFLASDCGNFLPFNTGFPTIDWINSGIGGFPRGGMTLVHGAESTGKSTLILESIQYAQQLNPDLTSMFIDVENALTADFLKFKGVDPKRIGLTPLNACEDALTIAKDAIQENIFDIIVIDSLAKLDSEKILANDIGEAAQRNRRAVLITEFLRGISFTLRRSKTALVCINQEVQNQDAGPYAPKTILPCGMQQKYSANLRLELKRSKSIKSGDEKVGYQLDIISRKNKISDKENAKTKLTYLFDRGFVRTMSVVDYLTAIQMVRKLPQGRFEFVNKEYHPEPFKPKDINDLAVKLKENFGINVYEIQPTEDLVYDEEKSEGGMDDNLETTTAEE